MSEIPSQNSSSQTESTEKNVKLPSNTTLQNASKLGIALDKPIMMDYWSDSLEKKCLIGMRKNGEKVLAKNQEEFTSPIAKFYKCVDEYIIVTENSIYIVASNIEVRNII